MFSFKYIATRSSIWKKYLNKYWTSRYVCNQPKSYSSLISYLNGQKVQVLHKNVETNNCMVCAHKRCYSKSILDGDASNILKNLQERELKKITELFPHPRATLNELQTKTPDKIFEVHYKQKIVAPKGKKKKIEQNDWHSIYTFVWPEKMRFESSAISKRQAGDKAATQALHWLYINGRINDKGSPIYDKNVLTTLRKTLNEPIQINISDKSMNRIDRIWTDYQNGIKDLYETTFKDANRRLTNASMSITKDSTIDEDDISDNDLKLGEEISEEISEIKSNVHPVYGSYIPPPSKLVLDKRDRILNGTFEKYNEELTPLPIDEYAEEIIKTLESSRVTVIVGAAGCGKSSRAPAAVLRHLRSKGTIVVSEPRRVAAIGLAERVASEMGEEVGDSVGYQVRLKARLPRPPGGSILYCTSGVLLRRLQTNPGLDGCSHVFIDEAHERDVNTDITLLLLKRAIQNNPDLKVVIMSATLDTAVFTRYFESCPVVEVPGRTFPVEVSYLDDVQKKFNVNLTSTFENCQKVDSKPIINCQEVVEVIKAVDKKEGDGAILVFLPGWAEIKSTKQQLDEHYGTSSLHMILPVHSRLSTTDQVKMFGKPPPGVRKIVLATNIAETSITIPDVVYVIDTGAQKENRIKEKTGTASLETVWVSQAGAKQRTGRAGRVQPGHCYRLYTRELEEEFAPHSTPEILRIPLVQTVLECKSYAPGVRVEEFLSELPEPPSRTAVRFAVEDLIDLGALTQQEQLTRVGTLLSSMTVHPRLGRSMLHGAVLGNVLAIANVIAHCGDNIELFRDASDRREEIRSIKSKYSSTSDHASLHWLQNEFEELLDQNGWHGVDTWCDRYGLRKERLGYVKALSTLYIEQLVKTGMIDPTMDVQELNRFSDIDELTSAVLLSGANALLITKRHVKTKGKLATVNEMFTSTGERAHIGSESLNTHIRKRNSKTNILAYFGGYHSTERRALVVYKTSLISPHAVLLFSMGRVDKETETNEEKTLLHIPRHKLTIQMPTIQANQILRVREMLWNTLQYYIDRDVKNIDYDVMNDVFRFKVRLVKTAGRILVEGEREYVHEKKIESIEDHGDTDIK